MNSSERVMSPLDIWLDRISGIHPVGWDLGLDRVGHIGEALGVLHPASKVILVAGTNGKGSTCEYLSKIAMAAGLKTGKSTSPHLFRFNERIVIDGLEVDDETISAAFEQIDKVRRETTLTYFEFASLASLLIFQQSQVDIAILEVGLGGRLDAMNIVDPDLCIITSISVDHQSWLGDTREAIAREKAGILRSDVRCIVADRDPPETLLNHARAVGAPLDLIGKSFDVDPDQRVKLPGDSFAAACKAADSLNLEISSSKLVEIADETTLPGRRTWLQRHCPVLLDVAHNPAASADLAAYVDTLVNSSQVQGDIHALIGIYKDKDLEGVLRPFRSMVKTWHLSDLDDPRGESAGNLANLLKEDRAGPVETYAKIDTAIQALEGAVGREDLILVMGSFPVVAGALQYFYKEPLDRP